MRLYLAHPILDRKWVREEELKMEAELGIELANPFYDSDGIERGDIKSIDSGKLGIFDRKLDAKQIVEADLAAIDKSNGIVAIITGNLTVGTSMEIFYNSYVLHKPTYLIITDAKLYTHPWLKYMATKRFISVKEFKTWWIEGLPIER